MGYWIIGLLVLGGLTGLSLVFEEASAYSVRGTIRIEGDANFTLGNGVSAGSGTELDPYIIDGWEIDGGGVGRCIYVGNTTKHFVIRNCNLTNSSGNNALYYRNAGISLYNVTNFVIENCTISGNGYGIYLDSASGFTITGSHFEDNGYGIYLSIDGTGLDRDFTILEMIVKDNDFKMTTNNRAVYFDIDLCYGFNGPHDVKIGNITVTGNEMFMNGTSAYGIDIDSLDVYELEDGNITIGNVNISDNRIFGGNFGFYLSVNLFF